MLRQITSRLFATPSFHNLLVNSVKSTPTLVTVAQSEFDFLYMFNSNNLISCL